MESSGLLSKRVGACCSEAADLPSLSTAKHEHDKGAGERVPWVRARRDPTLRTVGSGSAFGSRQGSEGLASLGKNPPLSWL